MGQHAQQGGGTAVYLDSEPRLVVADLGPGATAGTKRQAAESDIVILATNWVNVPEALKDIDWHGRILIDATNAHMDSKPDVSLKGVNRSIAALNGRTSSEMVAEMAAGARLVKSISNMPMAWIQDFSSNKPKTVIFTSGDDSEAKKTVIDLIDFPMPIYNADEHARNGFDANALKFQDLIGEHDGLLISSPEYNGSIPPLLKNTIDWVSRVRTDSGRTFRPFAGKVAGLCSSSNGHFAGIRCINHLRAVLVRCQMVVVTPECSVPEGGDAFDVKVTVTSVAGDTINFTIERVGAAPATVTPAATAAAAPKVEGKSVAQSVLTQLAADGKQVDEVSCPDLPATVGASQRCTLKAGGDTYGVTVTVTSVQGTDVKFDIQVDSTPITSPSR